MACNKCNCEEFTRQRLELVKQALGLSGNFHDGTMLIYITEVESFLRDAGVPAKEIYSARTTGLIARGVSDLWNYGNEGKAQLSPYFIARTAQLKLDGDE